MLEAPAKINFTPPQEWISAGTPRFAR